MAGSKLDSQSLEYTTITGKENRVGFVQSGLSCKLGIHSGVLVQIPAAPL